MFDTGSLSAIKVLDLSRMLPGPYCSMILADHGAQVIAIEDNRYKAEGNFVGSIYRNKRHMTLDLKTRGGQKILLDLVKKADVFIEGFRPGVAEKLGIDYDALCALNSKIIYCSITGFGQSGDRKGKAGHDVNYLSYAGFLDQVGRPDSAPVIPGIPIADIAGGSMNAALGILLALFAREKTGNGQRVDISMTDGSLGLMQLPLFFREVFGQTPTRGEGFLSHRYACYSTYETKDGRYLSIGAVENRFWKTLCKHLGVPEYDSLQYDETSKNEIIEKFKSLFREKTLDCWEKELSSLDVCFAPVRTLDEVLEDPCFKERKMVVDIDGEGSSARQAIGIPIKLDRTPGSLRTPPVGFGENTQEILEELNYSKNEIEEFNREGATGQIQ